MASTTEIEEFMQSPIVTWLQSCLDNSEQLQDYDALADGGLIHQVLLLIDPEPIHHGVSPSLRNACLRIRNMSCIIKNIKVLYEEELCQLVVLLPDCVRLGKEPDSKEGLEDMRLLLLLLLGCAVQCPNKHTFIERIKTLPIECQHTLVHYIQKVTESQEIVLTSENCDKLTVDLLLTHVRRLVKERDNYFQLWLSVFEEKKLNSSNGNINVANAIESQSQHLVVELADWKAKHRKLRQELEEKSESLTEVKEELERNNVIISKLKSEVQDLKQEARAGKAYRDEVDVLREKAERCDRLETEIGRYREKLGDLEYHKSRVEELRLDNCVLEETREMLEEQLTKARKKAEHALKLESDILQHKQTIDEITMERDAIQDKLQELIEDNTRLRLLTKNTENGCINNTKNDEDTFPLTNAASNDNSLSEQLNSSVQTRVLKLELENKKLLSTIENLQDSAFHRNNERILDLEKEKKRLTLQVDSLEEMKRKYSQHVSDAESNLKDSQCHLKRLQESNEFLQQQLEAKQVEMDVVNKEKRKLEDKLTDVTEELNQMKQNDEKQSEVDDLLNKIMTLEKEIAKLKRTIQENKLSIEKLTSDNEMYTKENECIKKQLDESNAQLTKLHELEKETQELESQRKMNVATLSALESDLVSEKLKTKQLQVSLDTLGLAIDNFADPGKVLDKIVSNPEVLKAVRKRLLQEQAEVLNEVASINNAKLQVSITTLQSQINSLSAQHTALQLANSQLAAEKEEAIKELNDVKSAHERLSDDQRALQSLHEQLSAEYEHILKEKESLKTVIKDMRTEMRNLHEKYNQIKLEHSLLESEKENYLAESKSLTNLRIEHSKLKDDFKKLFASSEIMNREYRSLQEQYKTIRKEAAQLKLTVTDLRGKLSNSNERITGLEMEISNLNEKCELLLQVKNNLEENKHSLMDHVTTLLAQYHELWTHSLEDKDHYHMEEKVFADKVNSLYRQKEKLEDKIMDQYRRMNCPNKKKGFGAKIVRRMKKAGSELINKNRPRSLNEDSLDQHGTDSESGEDDVHSKRATAEVDDNLSYLSIPGTRRTVYLSGNEHVDADNISSTSTNDQDDACKSTISEQHRSVTPLEDERPPLLIYNRVTANLGGNNSSQLSPTPPLRETHPDLPSENSNVEKPIWFEYGCV